MSATVLAVGIYISGEAIKPVVQPTGNLLTNGDFSQGLEGWAIGEHGYYSPKYTYKSTETKYCEKLGSGSPPPTGWKTVQVNLGEVIRDHLKIDASKVVKVRVGAGVTGTHEDRTYAVGYFDDFSLMARERELPFP